MSTTRPKIYLAINYGTEGWTLEEHPSENEALERALSEPLGTGEMKILAEVTPYMWAQKTVTEEVADDDE